MQIKKTVLPVLAATLASQPLMPAFASNSASTTTQTSMSSETRGELAALTDAQRLNLNLLIATVIVDQKMGALVAVDEAVAKKYQMLKAAYLGSVPTSSVGGAALALGQTSSARVEFLIAPLTALLRASGRGLVYSGRQIDAFSRVTGLDVVINKSVDVSARSVENVIVPILKIFVTKNTMLSSATGSASSVFAGSVFFLMNDSKEAMNWETARQVLGQNDVVRLRIDSIVNDMSSIFDLDSSAQAALKIAIYDEAMKQAVANKFSDDKSKYSLDIVDIMKSKKIITSSMAAAVETLRSLTSGIKVTAAATNRAAIAENVEMSLNLAAVLESQLNSGRVQDPRLRAELERMLGSIVAKLSLIGFNLKKN